MDYRQLDAAEKYLRTNRFKESHKTALFLIILLGGMIFIAFSFLSFILKGTNE